MVAAEKPRILPIWPFAEEACQLLLQVDDLMGSSHPPRPSPTALSPVKSGLV